MTIELVDQVPVQNELGEGVIWDHHRQRIWWTDIGQKMLYRYDPLTSKMESWSTPERLCCFAPVAGQNYLVAAFESGFAFYEPVSGQLQWIHKIEQDNPGTRLNDGRTDRQGRFWAGTMVENRELANDKGRLYCIDHELNLTTAISGLSITNSLCWSPDSKILYHCDTPSRQIDRYVYDSNTGTIGKHSVFTTTAPECYPDGSNVDAEGYVWNAQWGGRQVVRYAPDGGVNLVVPTPASQPTCVAFGGKDLDLLIVTSAYQGLDETARAAQSDAGDLFIYRTDYRGLVEAPFKLAADKQLRFAGKN